MGNKLRLLLTTFLILICYFKTQAEKLSLSPQDVINQVITSSREAKDIKLTTDSLKTAEDKAHKGLDWTLESSINYTDAREVNLQAFMNERDKTLFYSLGVNKTFATGTTFSSTLERQSRESILNPLITANNPNFSNVRTADRFQLSLSQDLWRNALGTNMQQLLESGDLQSKKADLLRVEKLEALALEALKLYWGTYVAKENLRASHEAEVRFEELTQAIKSQARLGYSNPGELNITLAELEERKQKVKRDTATYLEKRRELFRLLQSEIPEDIVFKVSNSIPSPPDKPEFKVENLREIVALNMDLKVADNMYQVEKQKYYPDLKLSLSATFTGANDEAQEAWDQALSGDKPIYVTGLTLNVPLDSKSTNGEVKDLLYQRDKKKVEFHIAKDKLKNLIQNFYETTMANFLIAGSYQKSFDFRQKAASEIEKAFRQGRSDISALVQAFNSLSESETIKIKSLGDYHISTNELAAALDLLIKNRELYKETL